MPTWGTDCQESPWYGGGTRQDDITGGFNDFIGSPGLDNFPGLRACLDSSWGSFTINCGGPECSGLDGRRSGNTIWICTTDTQRIAPVLLHEMVHGCGGHELDSEAIEHYCYDGNGATSPNGDDWTKFRDETNPFGGDADVREGRFVIWDSRSGEVWARTDAGQKGTRLFQSDAWKHDYSGGGGWM